MTAEQYLEQIKKYDLLIENKRSERLRWTELADGMGSFSTAEKVKSTHNPHKTSNAIITYCDIDRQIAELENKRQAVIQTLERLPLYEYSVLYKLYVQYKAYDTMKDIAYDMRKSYGWVKITKAKALRLVQEILDLGLINK